MKNTHISKKKDNRLVDLENALRDNPMPKPLQSLQKKRVVKHKGIKHDFNCGLVTGALGFCDCKQRTTGDEDFKFVLKVKNPFYLSKKRADEMAKETKLKPALKGKKALKKELGVNPDHDRMIKDLVDTLFDVYNRIESVMDKYHL